ncbi:Tip elongation aberrant protein 3 [Tolypocladium paradoxum]|uniref:Tip elongation aberrant protein 3 n=1 Tax=Tolypocladium paradoxum TaxID=94208 RepID=A0A2S4KWV1_9HYPO|nr:Tip elongation aberrant protein 3 [Tolypocladium paradoxum]
MMEPMAKLKRRSTDLMHQVQQSLPAMPQMPLLRRQSLPWTQAQKDGMKGTWERIDIPALPRSSHSLNVVSGSAFIFGGEINPREPVDNDMHVIRLPFSSAGADYYKVKAKAAEPEQQQQESYNTEYSAQTALDDVPLEGSLSKGKEPATAKTPEQGDIPSPRVGHATAVIGSRIFLFGGRGGPDMKPLEEAGRVWVYDIRSHTWTHLDPVPAVKGGAIVPHPAPRSYHCATATDHPRGFARPPARKPQTWRQWAIGDTSRTGIPQDPIVGNVAEDAVDQESEGYGTFFVHAGCLANGDRTSDLWAFDVSTHTWTELPAAPGPARGGTAICISKSRLFRFGGYDGEKELGGQLDFLHLQLETFDDRTTKGEISVHARPGGWQTILANNIDASSTEIPAEALQPWPSPRSVASLQALTIGGGREYLVLTMGESGPSSDGHAGAGTFFSDVWTFQVPPLGMSAASLTDAMLQAVGRKTGEGKWIKVATGPYDDEQDDMEPAPRGWMASAPMADVEESGIVIWGGLGEDNNRIGDGWILRLGN